MPSVLVRLRPTGPWRIGPDSGDRDRVERIYHSDALYSAVCGAMARLGILDDWLDATRAAPTRTRGPLQFLLPVSQRDSLRGPAAAPVAARLHRRKFAGKARASCPLAVVESLLAASPPSEDAWTVDGESECLMPATATAGSTLFRASVRSSAAVDRAGDSRDPALRRVPRIHPRQRLLVHRRVRR